MSRTRDPELSTLVSLVVLIPSLIAVRSVAATIVHAPSPGAVVGAIALSIALAAALVAQDRWLARPGRPRIRAARNLVKVAALAGLGLALGLTRAGPAKTGREPRPDVATRATSTAHGAVRPNVLVISIDSLRPDRLSLYGYERDTTPFLRQLARESVVFTHAVSPGSWTLPGHAAMLTGRFPGSLGALARDASLPDDVVTLAERLAQAGYRTGAVVANASSLDRRLGWAQGFDFYSDDPLRSFRYEPSLNGALRFWPLAHARTAAGAKTAAQINETARSWLEEESGVPFFLFLNYMDTHHPYVSPGRWPDRYPGRRSFLVDPVPAVLRGQRDLTPSESLHLRALYDGAVAYVDFEVGKLLTYLEKRAALATTVVIVTSDHGEFFGEHRLLWHAVGPYDPVHRVPLLIRYRGGRYTEVIEDWVHLVDLVPTILNAIGLPVPAGLDGDVLPNVKHPILIEQAPHPPTEQLHGRGLGRGYAGLYEGSHKFVAFDDGARMLFDLSADPGERQDLSATDPGLARLMQARLAEATARYPRLRRSPPPLDPEVQERLRAGGYLQ